MKRNVWVLLALVITGCGSTVVKKPAVLSVKRLAVVSFNANHEIYDVEKPPAKRDPGLGALISAATRDNTLSNEHVQLTTAAMQAFIEEMRQLPQWQVLAPVQIQDHPAYKKAVEEQARGGALFKAVSGEWVTPPGLVLATFRSVAGEPNTIQLGQDSTAETKQQLVDLCRALDVDAVAVVTLNFAYKTGFLSGMSGTGLFSSVRGRATPTAATTMIAVTKDGSTAVQTSHTPEAFEAGDTAPMLLKGRVDLTGEDGQKSIALYTKAVRASTAALRERMRKELSE